MTASEISTIIHPVIVSILTALAAIIGTLIARSLNQFIAFLHTKVSANTFNQAMEVATGIYILLEDKYKKSGLGTVKKEEMETMLLEKFPSLTKTELDSINKQVWLSFNAGIVDYSNAKVSSNVEDKVEN